MCTTGVVRFGPGDYALFKNKDFGRTSFDDRIVLDRDVFGVEGITTWAGDDPACDEFSGFSIGANRHGVLCCDANVQTIDGLENYDRAVEIALREGRDVAGAVDAVRRAARTRPFMWGNLVIIDAAGAAAVEIRGSRVEAVPAGDRVVRTNHHVVLGQHPADQDTRTTVSRLGAARRRLAGVAGVSGLFDLLAAHDDGDTGICNHDIHDTVYSYVLHRRDGATTLYVGRGRPCSGPVRHRLVLPLGDAWSGTADAAFRAAYPSARTAADAPAHPVIRE